MHTQSGNNNSRQYKKARSSTKKACHYALDYQEHQVEVNTQPIDVRIEEISVRELAKIQSKNIVEPIKQQLEQYLSNNNTYKQQESPFGKAVNQSVDRFKAKKVDIKKQ